ncbi:MAG: cytochrome c-type biogenesis CcmF C-terminal domain-containing protein [Gemmatimonadaceae bacterium]|nr:cytochrome c-type biogenesis CcmF C-terminal domain-containing protein [Gemmatimonadaceae bacterium]
MLASLRLIGNNRRRYGGYIVHLGVAMIFAAFAGFAFKKEFDVSLKTGEVLRADLIRSVTEWTFTSQGVSEFKRLNRYVTAVALSVTRDGKPMPVLSSEKRQHVDSNDQPTFEPSTEVGLYETTMQDVYMVFSGMIGPDQA